MSEKAKQEFPLDQFSEAETDEDFGLPEYKEHFADTLTPAVLRDWTAKDFACIYVRFRPHLERHARRFLVNPSQVEEVVQDAFLYLMTTLPELDSELGVLKFLKWKVRLLSLDVIRINSRASIAPLDELPDMKSDEPETSEGIERAEDAAVVSMALAKLQPRQRAALIMTLYEELPQSEAAMKLGLNDNAFRQLLLRSRRAFKVALVGEAETAGLSLSQILSLAAKKASTPTLGAIASVIAIAIAVLPSVVESNPSNLAQEISSIKSESFRNFPSEQSSEAAGILGQAPDSSDHAKNPGSLQFDSIDNFEALGASSASVTSNPITQKQPTAVAVSTQDSTEEVEMTRTLLETSLDREQVGALSSHVLESVPTLEFIDHRTIRVDYPELSAHIVLGEETEDPVQFVYLTVRRGEVGLTAVPLTLVAAGYLDANQGSTLELGLTDLIIGDMTGHFDNVTVSDSSLSRSYIKIMLFFGPSGELGDARLSIAQGASLDS